eukprot:Gb_14490 [translate_table: standard]
MVGQRRHTVHGDERRKTAPPPLTSEKKGEEAGTSGQEQTKVRSSVPNRGGIVGARGDDEENDPNRDKKRKRPHEEEVPPIKGRRTSRNRALVDSSSKDKQATHPSSPSASSEPTQQNIDQGMTTVLDFSKQHASFSMDSDRKTIKVRASSMSTEIFTSKGNGEPYPRMVEINELRDSFALKKEVNKEACDNFAVMRHNLFGKKTTLEMVALENSITSPWHEGQLVLKGDHMNLLQSEETKIIQTLQNGETLMDRCKHNKEIEFILRQEREDVALVERDFRNIYLKNKYFIIVKRRDIQDRLWRLKELEAKNAEAVTVETRGS